MRASVIIPTASWQQGNPSGVMMQLTPGQYAVNVQQTEQDAQGGAGDVLLWSQARLQGQLPCTSRICPFDVIAPHLVWSPYGPVPPAAFVPHRGPVPLQAVVLTIGDPYEQLGGLLLRSPAAPLIRGGRTLVPLRALGELLGATVHRDAYQQQIVVTQATHTVVLTVGRRTYTVDGTPHVGDAAPVIVPPGSTLVPLRFVREALGLEVGWIAATRQVIVQLAGSPRPSPAPISVWLIGG